ncbi:uncharacterized protein T551_03531 [Pneumocystis jirovecii RU7]|uniref:F-box domain-containing protein n=1 Tax=Pneumocystis jirovecii (strain RU7) TaxID=1408657 RepID=A0A0W4ZD57_PNEJ7|nr:uncharacterized protein T551_03531 [Pneumocystis jirovecii RU7]KTW26231.1 hypothetical protein T551_03531 [Pneumocystis jirovecii RU7]
MYPIISQKDLTYSFKDMYVHANPDKRRSMIDILFMESSPADLCHLPYELLQIVLKYLDIEDIIIFPMENIIFLILKKIISTRYASGGELFLQKGKPKSFRILYFHNKITTCSLCSRLQDNYLILYSHATSESSNKGITLYRLGSNITQEDAIYISTKNEGMLNVSLDSYILAGVNYFGVFYIWSLESLELINTFKIESSDIAFMICYNGNICIYTFSHVLSVWNLKLKEFIFRISLKQINSNLSNKHNVIAIEFLERNNELVLCIENTTKNNEVSYYEYRIYIFSADHGHLLRHENLINKYHPFKLNIIKKDELIIFYQFNNDHYWKIDLRTMKITSCLSHKNHIQELECLIYPRNSLIIKYLKSANNSSDDGLYVEKINSENGALISRNKILESENIIYNQLHYLKNKYLLQGNDNWIIYNQQNKILLWEF